MVQNLSPRLRCALVFSPSVWAPNIYCLTRRPQYAAEEFGGEGGAPLNCAEYGGKKKSCIDTAWSPMDSSGLQLSKKTFY
jgi:hypothetical protein